MTKYRVEVSGRTDAVFDVEGFETEDEVVNMFECGFDYFALDSRQVQIVGEREVGYLTVEEIRQID